jgi:acylphosphatase
VYNDHGAGNTMPRLTATVHGRVQGVGFRASTQTQAQRLGVRGWVANQWDGSVRVVAEGPEDALRQLATWLHHGPPAAHVDQVDIQWSDGDGELRGFQVRH